MHSTQSRPPHLQRCRRMPRPWPIVVPVLHVLLAPVQLRFAHPFPQRRRKRVLRWWRWQSIDPTSVVAAGSPVAYTSDEVAALDRYRSTVEAVGPRAKTYDLFLCHAWDDRRGTATELHDLLEAEDVSVWFSERDIVLGQPFMREIDKGLAKTRIGLVLITPALLRRVESGGVSEKELSELLSRDLLIPVAHGVTYDEIRSVSPLLGSRHGLSTEEDSMEDIAKKIAELIAV